MSIDNTKIQLFGDELFNAWKSAKQITSITDREDSVSIEQAYKIQLYTIGKRKHIGQSIIGKKIGITSKPVMNMLKVDQPDFGHLMSDMKFSDGDVLDVNEFCQPKGEGEIAFILKKGLQGPGVTNADTLAATDYLLPAFEIVDSRIDNWQIKIQDTVADNASAGAFVLGSKKIKPQLVNLTGCQMTLKKNGEVIGVGLGAATMGNPITAVTWLANKLGDLGIKLEAGEIILSGALSAMFPIRVGDELHMEISQIGQLSCKFR